VNDQDDQHVGHNQDVVWVTICYILLQTQTSTKTKRETPERFCFTTDDEAVARAMKRWPEAHAGLLDE
jgi:hypothetical protein